MGWENCVYTKHGQTCALFLEQSSESTINMILYCASGISNIQIYEVYREICMGSYVKKFHFMEIAWEFMCFGICRGPRTNTPWIVKR